MNDQTTIEEPATEEKVAKNLIGEKYRGKYKTPDWIGEFVNERAVEYGTKMVETKVVDEDGNEVVETKEVRTKKKSLNLDTFFALCEMNNIDPALVARMKSQREGVNAIGRIRMTLGNSLRAAARKRGGLLDLEGNFVGAPESITKGAPPIETPNGEKLVTASQPAEASDPLPAEDDAAVDSEE